MATNPLITETFQGLPGGMNLAIPAHELPPTQAQYMQDIILNRPGIIQRRGLLAKVAGSATVPFRATNIVMCQDPAGVQQVAVLAGDATHARLYFYNTALSSIVTTYDIPINTLVSGGLVFDPALPRFIVDSKPALNGGVWIGISQGYTRAAATNQTALMLWKGATKTATPTATAATGIAATTVHVSSGTSVQPGQFLYNNLSANNPRYVGEVLSVSGTTVTLVAGALDTGGSGAIANTDPLLFTPIRPFQLKYGRGRISTDTGSAVVQGTQGPLGTSFTHALNSNIYTTVYRLSDNKRVGTISLVRNQSQLVLNTPASVGMTDERYYLTALYEGSSGLDVTVDGMLGTDGISTYPVPGFLNAVWAGRQWFANKPSDSQVANASVTLVTALDYTSRLWFSDPADGEMLDMADADGDYITIQSPGSSNSPIMCIWPTIGGLAVLKEEELFVVLGNDPSNFSVRKIGNVGVLHGESVVSWNAGIVYCSPDSIQYFDGANLRDITPQLGNWYSEAVKAFNPMTDRMSAVLYKDHYIVYIDNFQSSFTVNSSSTNTWTKLTLCVNLLTGAVTTWTNVAIKGSIEPPTSSGKTPLFLVDNGATPGTTSIIDTGPMFVTNPSGTADAITCGGWSGNFPDFFIEMQKYTAGDAERKKLFKQLAMTYISSGGTISLATVPGLNAVGTVSSGTWPATTTFANKRVKFTKRDTLLSLRLYQTTNNIVDLQIGPYALGFKMQRVGRT